LSTGTALQSALFPSCYLPPIDYYARCIAYHDIYIDSKGIYIKQTIRNRCFILSPNGIQCLSIPVQHTGGRKTPIKEIKISYAEQWQRLHWRSLFTAYGRSPYFEFLRDELEILYKSKYIYLVDLNREMFTMIQKIINEPVFHFTEPESAFDDMLFLADSKTAAVKTKSYPQVFNYKFGFVAGLSIIDLVFNTGPGSSHYLI
jgi:hypothetical protein